MIPTSSTRRPVALALLLIVAGMIGWWAAFSLTIEKIEALENPGRAAGCDFSVLVQCTENLNSPQGAIFGFPNPLIGLAAWIAPIVVGVALLAGARFARWFWVIFWLGFVGAISFVVWLITQSIFVLGTLCPWCMVTWSVTIPSFLAVTAYVVAEGALPLGAGARRAGKAVLRWVPLATVLAYVVIAVIAQLRLDVLSNL
ncbi:vitamin K epoxide reductase family protein [Labedella endophytica]|uniref:Vitamin K epoxide reductase family protein n=1 Tax=Labedella endophytica TaxID=1523160 RepID=A0A3S1CP93_9MICO|nr:vitamin K epoxide reductase family protein [Labedella endophytica]RUQ97184.1 vitamin K epoxide reductase family protein [Labedella endophytica]